MKSFTEASDVVYEIINNNPVRLTEYEEDLRNCKIGQKAHDATHMIINEMNRLYENGEPICHYLETYGIISSILIGIQIGLEMSKPTDEELFELWKRGQNA